MFSALALDFASINRCSDAIGLSIVLLGHCDMRYGVARVLIET